MTWQIYLAVVLIVAVAIVAYEAFIRAKVRKCSERITVKGVEHKFVLAPLLPSGIGAGTNFSSYPVWSTYVRCVEYPDEIFVSRGMKHFEVGDELEIVFHLDSEGQRIGYDL